MSTPRTDNFVANTIGYADQIGAWMAFARSLETETANLRRELAEVTAAFQAECDHEFETEDHSFSHEFGTERIFVCRCTKCGKDAEPGDVPDPDDDGCDDDDPDYDAPKPLTPLENHQRNDEHSNLL